MDNTSKEKSEDQEESKEIKSQAEVESEHKTEEEFVTISNESEIIQNTDPDVVEINDNLIAQMMKKMLKSGKLPTDSMEEEEIEERKPNKGSRQNKKRLEEQRAAFRKEKEEREKKEKELFEAQRKNSVVKSTSTRPLSTSGNKLKALAMKQKSTSVPKKQLKKEADKKTVPKEADKKTVPKETPKVDIHKIFNRSGVYCCMLSSLDRSMDPKLARILYDTSVLPKASTKPPVKPKEFSFAKRKK